MVTVYTRKGCPWCIKLKSYLKNNNISYDEIDVGENLAAYDVLVKESNQSGVPVININGCYIVGFDKSSIDKALNIT
ncbi:MAG: glutaredoxin domain-containing protein [Clostridium sp.]|uniref:glutaredoxin domain-containing protein n=1 Tax=Clostridium sp. TaxID=1506 RepID=UPI002FC993E2